MNNERSEKKEINVSLHETRQFLLIVIASMTFTKQFTLIATHVVDVNDLAMYVHIIPQFREERRFCE